MIPVFDDDGLLPPGRHHATIDEVRARFVHGAPFASERQRIWAAFELWSSMIWSHFPSAPLWVNGGFVTHKTWAPPKDIDVVAIVRVSEYNNQMTPGRESELWTQPHPDPTMRVQPMGGLVDGFACIRGAGHDSRVWEGIWSAVKGPDGQPDPARTKGYLEVNRP